mgnify:FL=1
MHVHESVATENAVPDSVTMNFKLRRSQWFGFGVLMFLLIGLTVVLFQNADRSVADLETLSDAASTMSNDLLTQHESFQYASAFERWLSGMTSLCNLQIRRVELDQKLGLRDSS